MPNEVIPTELSMRDAVNEPPPGTVGCPPTTVMILSRRANLARALEGDLRQLDVNAVSVATPLNAIWHLVGDGEATVAIFVDCAFFFGNHQEWFSFLSDAHPHISRILFLDETMPPTVIDELVTKRVDAVLALPWSHGCLEELVTSFQATSWEPTQSLDAGPERPPRLSNRDCLL